MSLDSNWVSMMQSYHLNIKFYMLLVTAVSIILGPAFMGIGQGQTDDMDVLFLQAQTDSKLRTYFVRSYVQRRGYQNMYCRFCTLRK